MKMDTSRVRRRKVNKLIYINFTTNTLTQKLMVGKILKNLPYSWCETQRSPLYKTLKLKENIVFQKYTYRLYEQGMSAG